MKHRQNAAQAGVWKGSKGGLNRSSNAPGRARGGLAGVWTVCAGLLLAACSSAETEARDAAPPKSAATAAAAPAPPVPPKPAADKVAFADNAAQGEATREFAYDWPAAVSAIPELAKRFTAERSELLSNQKGEWEDSLKEFAGQDCVSCVNRDYQKSWAVVADLPRFLSLSADVSEYSGGAHGNYWSEALVWDREAKTGFDPKTMFRSKAALQDALGVAWCKALKVERGKKMGADYNDDGFFPCPPIADLVVLVGSSNKTTFNRIGLIAAPYVAGSYAEGAYEVTLPVTPKLLAIVKPEYKAFFALGK